MLFLDSAITTVRKKKWKLNMNRKKSCKMMKVCCHWSPHMPVKWTKKVHFWFWLPLRKRCTWGKRRKRNKVDKLARDTRVREANDKFDCSSSCVNRKWQWWWFHWCWSCQQHHPLVITLRWNFAPLQTLKQLLFCTAVYNRHHHHQ